MKRSETMGSRFSSVTILNGALAAAVAALSCAIASPARADQHWIIDTTFTDGATLTGYFDFNIYGYVSDYDLVTSAEGPFAGAVFANGLGNISPAGGGPSATSVTFYASPDYNGDQLTLNTSLSLTATVSDNSLLSTSFECQNSYSCPGGGDVRYLAAGSTLGVPEPASWVLMTLGVAGIGGALRRRKGMTPA